MFGEDLFRHKGRDRALSGGSDLFAFEFLWTCDLRPSDEPLQHPVIGRENDLQRSIAPRDAHQRARTRTSKLSIAAKEGLDAGRRRDKNHSLIEPLLLHVAFL